MEVEPPFKMLFLNRKQGSGKCTVRGLSGKYPSILNISRTGRMALM